MTDGASDRLASSPGTERPGARAGGPRRPRIRPPAVLAIPLIALGGVVAGVLHWGGFGGAGGGGAALLPLEAGRLHVEDVGGALLPSAVSHLRHPTITPVDQGFFVWGGTSTEPAIRSPHPVRLDGDHGSGVGAMYSGGSWSPMPRSPLSPRAYHASVWTGGELIVAGGSETLDRGELKADVAAYSPGSGTWRTLPPLPEPRADALALAVGGKVVIVGGSSPSGSYVGDLFVGTGSEPWATVGVKHPVYGAVLLEGALVVFGFTGGGTLAFSRVNVSSGATESLPALTEARFVSSYGVGATGRSLVAAFDRDDRVTLYSLVEGSPEWTADATFAVRHPLFGVNRLSTSGSAGAVAVDQDRILSATPRGLYSLSRDAAHRLEGVTVADHCENSVTSALMKDAAIFWVDRTCPRPGVFIVSRSG